MLIFLCPLGVPRNSASLESSLDKASALNESLSNLESHCIPTSGLIGFLLPVKHRLE